MAFTSFRIIPKRHGSKSKKKSSSDKSLSSSKRRSGPTMRVKTKSMMSSLGTGELCLDGSVSFSPSPLARFGGFFSSSVSPNRGHNLGATTNDGMPDIIGRCCSFLRVSDLSMDDESITVTSTTTDITFSNEMQKEHTHRPVVNPPPGIEVDPKERWIALCTTLDNDNDQNPTMDMSSSSAISEHTPIAPVAIECLANYGWTTALDETMWEPDSKSDKLVKKAGGNSEWMKHTFQEGLRQSPTGGNVASDVLCWQGSYKHGLYGSEVPAIRSAGVVHTSAKKLMELLVDSTRVKEYNKMSLGRRDLITFDGNLEEDGPFGKSITKVMKSESKPPMMSTISLTTILHAKKLANGSGYLIVNRSVHRPGDEPQSPATAVATSMKTEIVMGVNLILDFDDDSKEEKCLMINVNHMRSPMVPMYVAKRVAVTSAHKFLNDIRACF